MPNNQIKLTLFKIIEETIDTKSFFFRANNQLGFKPGQFINIGVKINGILYYRAYSMSSLPSDDFIQLTIKRVNGGKVSNWMNDHLNIGDFIFVQNIGGIFNLIDHPPKKNVVFISAGCGISPIFSMTKSLLSNQNHSIESIDFIHFSRGFSHLIFHQEILDFTQKYPFFNSTFYLDDLKNAPKNEIYQKNTFDFNLLNSHLKNKTQESSIYLCGPNEFMEKVKNQLIKMQFDLTNFFEESFSPNVENLSHSNKQLDENKSMTVFVPDFNFQKNVKKGENLLEVLQNGNIPIVAACRVGICGSCKCKVKSGKVKRLNDPVSNKILTQEQFEQGYVLACSSLIDNDDLVVALE